MSNMDSTLTSVDVDDSMMSYKSIHKRSGRYERCH